MMLARRHKSELRGVTLVELLVVVSIMAILAAIAISAIRPALEGRRYREAARSIDVYLGQARYRALETGRPCGVLFERFDTQRDAARVLRQVEVPPPYAGDVDDARLQLLSFTGATPPPVGEVWWDVWIDPGVADLWPVLVNNGDLLQLNYQGHLYRVRFPLPGDKYVIRLSNQHTGRPVLPAGVLAAGLPFKVFRQPLPSAAAPLQLTRGVVVDLGDSGTDTTRQWFAPASGDSSPVMIMFSPNGAVDRVIIRGSQRSVTEPIFLMVGRWDRTGSSLPEDGLENWQDQSNLWLAVNPQSGLATVAELNADAVTASGVYVPGGATPDERFYNSRKFARQAQISKGGR